MKKITRVFLLAFSLIAFCASQSFAQNKFGHVHVNELLLAHPQVKKADEELKTYQDGLVDVGKKMASALQAEYEALSAKVAANQLSPIQIQEGEASLQKKQQEIATYEQEVVQKVGQKREELYGPILQEVDEAIKAIGKENNYTFIFDSSLGNIMLYFKDSDDVMSNVKAKLGL